MNRDIFIILLSIILLCTHDLKGQGGQFLSCPPNIGAQNSILTAPTNIGASASVFNIPMWNSEYVTTTLTAGNTYKIYTSASTTDPMLTIFHNMSAVAFNDDVTYPNGLSFMESGIYFSPQYTGIYDIQIDEFGCGNQSNTFQNTDLTVELITMPQPSITIPVVVHVVHYGEAIGTGRNISDAQIHDQIAVLNADFSRSNTDFYLAPPVFAGVSANTNVQFCLAQQDPNGALTDGIERYLGTQPNYTRTDCDANLKPNTIWNAEDYLNIWIVDLDGGAGSILFGYAQFPTSLSSQLGLSDDPNTDGVVMNYSAFGTSSNNFPNLNLGRTVTHEVGHWLGLLHTFAFDCTADDLCDDTPLQGVATQNACPSFLDLSSVTASCNSSFPAMYNNFMDYTDDACMNMFTYNQNQLIQYVLATDRNTLLASNGCTPGVSIYGCTDASACNYDLLANTDDGSCDLPNGCGDPLYLEYSALVTCSDASSCLTLIVNGCTDASAYNYNSNANIDDGSCCYIAGCMDPSATNYNSSACFDDGSCNYPQYTDAIISDVTFGLVGCGGHPTQPSLDNTPWYIISYTLSNVGNAPITDFTIFYPGIGGGAHFSTTASGVNTLFPILPGDSLMKTIKVYRSSGWTNSAYDMEISGVNNETNTNNNIVTAYLPTMPICDTIYGCTDITACNYDSNASLDDGSCIFPDGCTDISACNYDASANCDDGSCILPDGCTDATACNYDATANCDDASCYYYILASIIQDGENLYAATTPVGLNADWYNIQTEDATTRIWLMEEDASSFSPTFECSYFIVVSDNGCVDTSETYYYGANAARIGSVITSPNPTSGLINVKYDNPKNQFVMFELISNNGTKLDEFITIADNLDINLSKYPSGTYYLYFDSEDAVQGCRLEELQKVSTKIILNK